MFAFVLAAVLTLSCTACGSSAGSSSSGSSSASYPTPENPITVKWGMPVSPTNQAYINAQVVADHVMEATDGAVKVELYPNSQLGNESAMWEGILSGTIDMANISTGTLSSTIPEFEAFTLPCVFGNAETFWNVLAQPEFRETFSEYTSKKGVVFVGFIEANKQPSRS